MTPSSIRERRSDKRGSSERFVVERTLGRGGMATVYLARDNALDRLVALKVLAPHLADDESFRDRFLREARLAAKLVHPNVVQVYDVGEDERGPFIVMEYVEGGTLADELTRRRRLPVAEVVNVGIQLCSALEAAHAAGLVHRDVKPQNVLRQSDGRVKIADFGIARSVAGTQHTEHGTVLGTAAYLAPEQARGEPVTGAADIYSLGVVLYELLTGQTPFAAETLSELLLKREQGAATSPRELVPGIPAELEAVVMRCLALRPEYRPDSAATLARELAVASDEGATEPLPDTTGTRATEVLAPTVAPSRRRVRRRLLAVLAGVAVCAVAAAIAFAVVYSEPNGKPPAAASHTKTPAKAATKVKTSVATAAGRFVSALETAVADGSATPQAGQQLTAQLQPLLFSPRPEPAQQQVQQFDQLAQTFHQDVANGQISTRATSDTLTRSLAGLAGALGTTVPPATAAPQPSPPGPGHHPKPPGHGPKPGHGHGHGDH